MYQYNLANCSKCSILMQDDNSRGSYEQGNGDIWVLAILSVPFLIGLKLLKKNLLIFKSI